jgi:hypothetical protein
MSLINKAIDELIKARNVTNEIVAAELSDKSEKPISPQRIGQYRNNKKKPGSDFVLLWKSVYGQDLTNYETKVSRGAENHTPAIKPAQKMDKDDRVGVYQTIVEGHTEYVLIPRTVLQETQLVSTEQINKTWEELAEKNRELERKNNQIDFYQKQFAKLMDNLELAPKPSKPKEVQ